MQLLVNQGMSSSLVGRVKWENDAFEEVNGVAKGKTSVCFNAIDRHFATQTGTHEPIVTWEGSFWECTEDVHDYAEFTIESLECVTRKVARALRDRMTDVGRLLVLLPNIIQLPLTVLAAERLGIVPVVVNPISLSTNHLASILDLVKPSLIVTVDGFFQGMNLVETKKQLDEAIELSKGSTTCNGGNSEWDPYALVSSVKEVIVIGHVGARPGVPPPTKEYPGRRPSYSIKVPRLPRDSSWSTIISSIAHDVDEDRITWRGLGEAVLEYPKWQGTNLTIAHISVQTVLEWTDKLEDKLSSGPSLLLSTRNDGVFTLLSLIAALIAGKKVVLYEGVLDYPDPARTSFIIKKYEVETLVMDSMSPLDEYYSTLVPLPSLSTVITKDEAEKKLFANAQHISLDLIY